VKYAVGSLRRQGTSASPYLSDLLPTLSLPMIADGELA
jgi:hypothetical protein